MKEKVFLYRIIAFKNILKKSISEAFTYKTLIFFHSFNDQEN